MMLEFADYLNNDKCGGEPEERWVKTFDYYGQKIEVIEVHFNTASTPHIIQKGVLVHFDNGEPDALYDYNFSMLYDADDLECMFYTETATENFTDNGYGLYTAKEW